jgi:hypothetical protein
LGSAPSDRELAQFAATVNRLRAASIEIDASEAA